MLTLMSKAAASIASASLMPSSANLLALYMPVLGKPPSAAMLETCTMWPDRWARRCGSTAWLTQSAPKRLTSNWARASRLGELFDHAHGQACRRC